MGKRAAEVTAIYRDHSGVTTVETPMNEAVPLTFFTLPTLMRIKGYLRLQGTFDDGEAKVLASIEEWANDNLKNGGPRYVFKERKFDGGKERGGVDGDGDVDEFFDGQSDGGDGADGDGQNQNQGQGGGDTIEDMIRRIADEQIDTNVPPMLEGFAKTQDAKGDGELRAVIARIEMKFDDREITVDGLAHNQMPTLIKMMQMRLNPYLPGPPGSGKSHSVQQAASILGLDFSSISFGPQTPESRLWGYNDGHGVYQRTPFRDRFENGGVFLADELDNGHGGIIATINQAVANRVATFPDGLVEAHPDFVFAAAANTYGTGPTAEFSGRNKLDAATLDRFVYIPWDTDPGLEEALVRGIIADTDMASLWLDVWRTARRNVKDHGLKVFVTQRGALNGARMVAGGVPVEDAYLMTLGNKLPADQAVKVNPL